MKTVYLTKVSFSNRYVLEVVLEDTWLIVCNFITAECFSTHKITKTETSNC